MLSSSAIGAKVHSLVLRNRSSGALSSCFGCIGCLGIGGLGVLGKNNHAIGRVWGPDAAMQGKSSTRLVLLRF